MLRNVVGLLYDPPPLHQAADKALSRLRRRPETRGVPLLEEVLIYNPCARLPLEHLEEDVAELLHVFLQDLSLFRRTGDRLDLPHQGTRILQVEAEHAPLVLRHISGRLKDPIPKVGLTDLPDRIFTAH